MKSSVAFLIAFMALSLCAEARAQQRRIPPPGGPGPGTVSTTCYGSGGGPTLWSNIPLGGTVSDAVTWEFGGVVPPYYGAYAEGYFINGTITGIQLLLTQDPATPNYNTGALDIYLWTDAGGPNNVLAVNPVVLPAAPSAWPSVDCYNFSFGSGYLVNGGIWAGCWPNWPGSQAEWFIAADTQWLGSPMTNFAPGIGYPTGWAHPSMVWPRPGGGGTPSGGRDAIAAFGIGLWGREEGTPAVSTSWGKIKNLYR